jgi:hypothetical protein
MYSMSEKRSRTRSRSAMASDDETAPTRSSEEKESKPNLEESPSTPFPEYSHDTSPSEKTPESPSPKLPESEVHFAFGPGDHYWIRCGSRWRMSATKNDHPGHKTDKYLVSDRRPPVTGASSKSTLLSGRRSSMRTGRLLVVTMRMEKDG